MRARGGTAAIRRIAARTVVPAVLITLVLAGCSTGFGPPPVTSSARAVPSASPTPTATGFGTGTAVEYSCDELIHPDVIAELDPRLEEDVHYRPAATTSAETAAAIGGTACRWVDGSTGTSLIVTVAHPDPPTLRTLRATTEAYATPTDAFGTYGVDGFTGSLQAEAYTDGDYWVTATSLLFTDATNTRLVMTAAIGSLPS